MRPSFDKVDEYILIAHPSASPAAGDSPSAAFRQGMRSAHQADNNVEWLADFELGPKDFTAIFKAPNPSAADRAAVLVGAVAHMHTYVLPLTTPWRSRPADDAAVVQ